MSEVKHTEVPWTARGQQVYEEASGHTRIVAHAQTVYGAGVVAGGAVKSFNIDEEEAIKNAAFIAKACSAHADLVAALEGALAEHEHKRTMQIVLSEPPWVEQARAALASAGEK